MENVALLEMRPMDESMISLDEIGENYENLKARVLYTTNKTEQARGAQKEMYVPVEVDYVSGSEPKEDDRQDVDEDPRRSTWQG